MNSIDLFAIATTSATHNGTTIGFNTLKIMKKAAVKEVVISEDVNNCDDDGGRASHYDENDVYQNIDEENENDELIIVSQSDEKNYEDMQLDEIISKIILNDKAKDKEKNKGNPSKNSHRYDKENENDNDTDLDEELDDENDDEEELELDEEDNYYDDFNTELKGRSKNNEEKILAKMDRMKKDPEIEEYENEFDEISGEKEKKVKKDIEVELDLLGTQILILHFFPTN